MILRKALRLRRALTEDELRDVLSEALDETKLLFQVIGALTLVWSEVEFGLDYTNGILIMQKEMAERKLPKVSLKAKLVLFRDGFDRISELASLRNKALQIHSDCERLSVIRHDIVHGVAVQKTPIAVRKVMRVRYEGNDLKQQYNTYAFAEITDAATQMVSLRNALFDLFKETLQILHPDQAKEAFGG